MRRRQHQYAVVTKQSNQPIGKRFSLHHGGREFYWIDMRGQFNAFRDRLAEPPARSLAPGAQRRPQIVELQRPERVEPEIDAFDK